MKIEKIKVINNNLEDVPTSTLLFKLVYNLGRQKEILVQRAENHKKWNKK